MRHYLLIALCLAASARAEEEEGSATLLLYKKLTPAEGPYGIGKPINITLQVWNKGPGNAYSVVVKDENWKQDKFKTLYSNNTFTLDFLNTGEQYTHTFTVTPVKKILAHRVKPAVMEFVDGVEGEATIKHYSNGWPEIQAVDPGDSLADYVLMFGRCARTLSPPYPSCLAGRPRTAPPSRGPRPHAARCLPTGC